MKKKKFITPKVRVIKLDAQELLAGSETQGVSAAQGSRGAKGQFDSNSTIIDSYDPNSDN